MDRVLDHEEVFSTLQQQLRLTGKGVSLLSYGAAAAPPQVARYEEIARPAEAERGRALQIAFTDGRPDWYVRGLSRLDLAWALRLLETGARRARLRQAPVFTTALPPAQLQAALDIFADPAQPDPYMLGYALLQQAVLQQATDLHLEQERLTGQGQLRVLLRLQGQLQAVATAPLEPGRRAVAAIKAAAGIPSLLSDRPATGRLSLPQPDRIVDVRITTLPTATGEKLTARLFDPSARPRDLAGLGFEPEVLAEYRTLLAAPQGCVILAGPAGSGKSTTLYASLEEIKQQMSWRNVATVEEPVEYILPGLQQSEVNREAGLDFAHLLRVVLRQDPQVIMVGEIRDPESAEIAVQAGLTGHLIFSTVHAPSAAGVFARLSDLGVAPYLLASSLSAVVTQRLVRTLCKSCAQPHRPSESDLQAAGLTAAEVGSYDLRRPLGCDQCLDGYAGRTALMALLPVTGELREAVMQGRPAYELERLATGLPPGGLWEAGLRKAARGEVDLPELLRVLGKRES